jgi:hypothetical protein
MLTPLALLQPAICTLQAQLQLVDSRLLGKVPLSNFVGVLGMPGLTAYASLKKIALPQPGEVAFVSGAAGAVGLTVGQLLKHVYGCTVIGSAGSDKKVRRLYLDRWALMYDVEGTTRRDGQIPSLFCSWVTRLFVEPASGSFRQQKQPQQATGPVS